MTMRDPDSIILFWLEDGPRTIPTSTRQSIEIVLGDVEQQRRRLWDGPTDRSRLGVAFAALVLVVVATGAFLVINRPNLVIGPPPTSPSARPSDDPSPTPSPARVLGASPTSDQPTATPSPEVTSGPPTACLSSDVVERTDLVVYSVTEIASQAPTEFKSGDLYLASADGSWNCQLTRTEGAEIYPTWSSDGTQIAFERVNRCEDTVDVVVLDLATGNEAPVGHGDGRFNQLAWSTTGEFLRLGGATFCWQDLGERVFDVASGTQALPRPADGGCLQGETELECSDRRQNVESIARGAIYRFASAQGVNPAFWDLVAATSDWGADLKPAAEVNTP